MRELTESEANLRVEALIAERDALKRDAERYRFLRDEYVRKWVSNIGGEDSVEISFEGKGHDIDAAVDAAQKTEATRG